MDYKFNDIGNEDSVVEFSAHGSSLAITSFDHNEDRNHNWVQVQVSKDEIDNLIIALTNIKNDIVVWERKANN